jgi:RHS repeat-associated protein
MNRTLRVSSLLSQVLVVLTVLYPPSIASAATTVATPTFSPAAGTYNSAQTVTISDTTSGSSIYYTTDGSTPTTSSTKYSGAITVSATKTLKALATATGDTNSAVATAAYTLVAPTPVLSLSAGTYGSSQTETITDSNSSATIYYTTNGTTPTTSSTKYTAAFTVNASETVEAIAVVTGYSNSTPATATYTFVAPTPVLSLSAGTYGTSQTETITDSNSGATVYYTTNGTTPTTSSTKYTAAFTLNASETVEAIAVVTGYSNSTPATATYTFVTPTPVFSLVGGSYYGSQTVTLSDSNSSAKIYYTTNGATPTTSSTLYSGAITVSSTETINTIAVVTGYSQSAQASATYTITTSSGTLSIYLSQPGAQSTTVAGVTTETFDALATGTHTSPYVSTAGIGTYSASSTVPFAIMAHDVYGGATDSSSSTPTNYFAVGNATGTTSPVYLTFAQPVSYFGFWWSAGDSTNRIALYSGTTLYGTFSTADLLKFLNNGTGTITATNGTPYQTSAYFGNPNLASGSNDSTEPFAYVSFSITGATITQIAFYNTGTSSNFESDNHSAIFNGNAVTIPTTFVPVENMSIGPQTVTVTVSPSSVAVNAGGTQQFTATVTGSTNTAVTWSVSPATGAGTISTSGLYTAPATVTTPQTVTITATSQANTAVSATGKVTLKATPTVSVWPTASGITYGQTLASSTLTGGTASVAGTFAWTAPTTAPNAGAASQSVTFTPTDTTDYNTVAGTVSVTVAKDTPSCTWPTPSGITYGQTLASSNLTAGSCTNLNNSAAVAGTFTWTTSSTVPGAGAHSESVTFTPTDTTDYNTSTGTISVTVAKDAPSCTWPTASGITYGQTLASSNLSGGSCADLNNSAAVAGTFAWTTPTIKPNAGASQSEGVTFTPTDTTDYNTVTGSSSVSVSTATLTITAGASPSSINYGAPIPTLSCADSSFVNGDTSASLSTQPSASTNYTAISHPGSYPVTCSGAVDPNYTFSYVAGSITVGKAASSITTNPTAIPITYGQALSASNLSGGVGSPAGGTFSWTTPATVPLAGTPSEGVTYTPTDATDYNISTGTISLGVAKGTPSCTWPTASSITYSQTLASSNLAGGSCINLNNSTAVAGTFGWTTPTTVPNAGTSSQSVTFTPTDTADYSTLAAGSVSVTVAKATPTVLTWPTASGITYGQTLASSTLTGGAASVAGTFAWTSPTTAPGAGTTLQSLTFTPTDTTDYNSVSGLVSVTLTGTQCASNGYSYQRVIVIDHTKVANTDQINFPFLFNATDPAAFAVTANGGHVTNSSGDDIVFSADPAGETKLNYELEEYDPVHGQVIAWIRIPTLSHTVDTPIYMFYGNSSIQEPQQNPTGVWDSNHTAVYHLANTASDSTANKNNGISTSVLNATGEIGGAAGFDGLSSYIQIPSADFASYPVSGSTSTGFSATFGAWFKTASAGVLLGQDDGTAPGIYANGKVPALYIDDAGSLRASLFWHLSSAGQIVTAASYNDNNWHFAVDTYTNGTEQLYVDGQPVGSQQVTEYSYSSVYLYTIGTGDEFNWPATNASWLYFDGSLDEINVSNIARSGDWVQTQYNNQSSPSTSISLYPENAVAVLPTTATVYPGQSQQFTITGICSTGANWTTTPTNAPGILTQSGLYTAPASITTQQNVTVTATSQASGTVIGSPIVTLLPSPSIALVAAAQPPYSIGSSQGFVATLQDQYGNPESGVAVTFTVSGVNSNSGSVTTDGNGIASYAYIGANAGNDTVQAAATINGQQLTSNSVAVSWTSPPLANAEGIVTIQAGVNLGLTGLCGAFTDNDGAVIEPIAIGAAPKVFVVPAGATQLQLGVVDDRYGDNTGSGFTVEVNGTIVTVPPTAMPWIWVSGGLNTNYKYGILDGTNPIIALTGLTKGAEASIAYQSGTVSAGLAWPYVNADGDQQDIVGTSTGSTGTYGPTLYLTASTYPIGQPVPITAVVTTKYGSALANVPVTLNVTGANAQELAATTNSTGTATFTYVGSKAGTDIMEARAFPSGEGSLISGQASITWTGFTSLPPSGSLTLTPSTLQPLPAGGQQAFAVYATDAIGNPAANVNLEAAISGVDNFDLFATTDSSGHANFLYQDVNPGVASVIVSGLIDHVIVYSNKVSAPWTVPGAAAGGSGSLSIGINADSFVTLPNSLLLNWTATDSALLAGSSPSVTWSQASGPGTTTFVTSQPGETTAKFNQPGNYVLTLSASDSIYTSPVSLPWPVTVNPDPGTQQGWIGSPTYGSLVTGLVPISLAPGVSLRSGSLAYSPANNTTNTTVLNGNVSGTGQIGTLDTTTLPNGTYWIQLQGVDSTGDSEYSLVAVTVAGNYKPGRVTATVTDLVVPATGLAINIQRTYDSLNAATSSDFGYGWSLGINTNLVVDPVGNVTFTLGGQRRTFNLTPQEPSIGIAFLPWYWPAYTPEPGLYGTLTDSGQGCPALDILVPNGSLWFCQGGGQFSPTQYTYTDPTGTAYVIGANGALQSIQDKNGNALTITSAGITSTTGLSVPFVRDSQGRITTITYPPGNVYQYGYDPAGNLVSVTYPQTPGSATCSGASAPNTTQYTYYEQEPSPYNHYYQGGTDGRCNPLPTSTYDANGRLQTVTVSPGNGAANFTTSYAYTLSTTSTINGASVPNTGVTTITYPDNNTATLIYDSYGDLLQSTDPNNLTTINAYDANHNLISVTVPRDGSTSYTTTYTYDANGNKTSTTYPSTGADHNTTSTTVYNQYSEPVSTTDELGNVRTFNYDANYLPTTVTDSLGTLSSFIFNSDSTLAGGAIGYDLTAQPSMASQFTYDANGNMASRTDALGRTTSYTYDAFGHKLSMTTPTPTSGIGSALSTTTYQYDAMGNLLQTSAPLGRTTSSAYDSNGNKVSDTDANGYVTHYVYDNLNRLVETDYPSDAQTPPTKATKTYDFRNNVIDEKDQAGNITHHVYDAAGRLTSITRGYNSSTTTPSTTSYTYYDDGLKKSETDTLGHATNYGYDAAGRLTSVSGVQGSFTYAYDDAGNRGSSTDARGNKTSYQYDARKRLVETDYPDGNKVVNSYDGPGNLASVIDQAGNEVDYTYDAANQLSTVVQKNHPDSSHNTNSYSYDGLGDLAQLADENGHTTVNAFNVLSELTQKTLPDTTSIEKRTYDPAGNLYQLTHFDGTTTTYTYDALNRLTGRSSNSPNAESAVSFTYTPTGKYLTSTAQDGTVNYTYDAIDRLITKVTPEGTLSYTYDAAGHVATIVSSNAHGTSVAYSYDNLNRLQTVTDSRLSGNQTTTYTYDDANNVATVQIPNGLTSTFTYDSLNRLTELTTSTTPATSYTYTLGATGIRTNATEQNGRAIQWSYDNIYRLTGETVTGDPNNNNGSLDYTLDPVGNRTGATSTFSSLSPGFGSYNADDEVSSETYDANGNTTRTANGNTFTYDSENHMTSMTSGATVVTMKYDAFGNRVSKTVNGVTTQYLVEDDVNPTGYPQVVEELVNGAVTRQYTYGLRRISENLSPTVTGSTWAPSFYDYDGFGTVRHLTNTAGAITDAYDYDAYGNFFTRQGSTPNNYLYRGEQYDSDLALYYLRARYYNPSTGRFMSRDPENGHPTKPASLHKYLYAHGDPVNAKDPSGRMDDVIEVGLIDLWIAARNTVAVAAAGAAVVCSLNRDVELLGGIAKVLSSGETVESVTFGVCTAKVKGKKNCNERHLAEQTFCVAEYGLHPTLLFQCMERAMWRWNNCLRGLPDPGPLDPLDPFWSQD